MHDFEHGLGVRTDEPTDKVKESNGAYINQIRAKLREEQARKERRARIVNRVMHGLLIAALIASWFLLGPK